jgi:hypothetical protein
MFHGVLADSRCPVDVVCIVAGDAIVELTVTSTETFGAVLRLHTTQESQESEVAGYRVRLERLEPERRAGDSPSQADYRVTVTVGVP